jgi:hypothetical protein
MSATVPHGRDREEPAWVVTLVPGTWAGKAAWAREDSPLHTDLTAAGCKVVLFGWSHGNSHQARARAAGQLVEHLKAQIKENPGARQWIVAHSHGGNVALHAVRRLRESSALTSKVSTVTLATPFIHARRRRAPSSGPPAWPFFLLVIFAMAAIAGASTLLAGGLHWRDWLELALGALVAGNALVCAAGVGMHPPSLRRSLLKSLGKRINDYPQWWAIDAIVAVLRGKCFRPGYQSKLIASVQSPQVNSDKDVFVIRAAGDEASVGLAAGQFLGWLSALLNPLLTNMWLWGVLTLAVQASALSTALIPGAGRGFIVLVYLFMGTGLVAVAALSVMLAVALPFGWDGPFLSILASCSAEAAPPGRATILQLEPFVGAETRGLAHCGLYRSKPVIDQIVALSAKLS